jgi:hypothetical protein
VHDSSIAEWCCLYQKLEEVYRSTGRKCCVDSAFAAATNDFLIRSEEDLTSCQTETEIAIKCTKDRLPVLLLRQASEWGMRAIQSAFPRLKDTINYEVNGERRILLKLVPLLYNIRLELVGLNQIRNVYALHWSKDADSLICN